MDPIHKYYFGVYPLATKPPTYDDVRKLEFFYGTAVPHIFKTLPTPTSTYLPPELGAPWIPIWYPNSTFAINKYDPRGWWNNQYKHGFKSGAQIEVMHVPDTNPFYQVFGSWFYVGSGTGVFLNIGKTLQARNKLHALHLLGMSYMEIANLIQSAQYMRNTGETYKTIVDLVSGNVSSLVNYTHIPNQLNQIAALVKDSIEMYTKSMNHRLSDKEVATLYQIDRIQNSANYDQWVVTIARAKGYDTVQFNTQANGNGGWCFEMVYVQERMFLATDKERMTYVTNELIMRSPFMDDVVEEQRCNFNVGNYGCLYCDGQTSNMQCRTPGQHKIPNYAK